jgi:hypothetical protein
MPDAGCTMWPAKNDGRPNRWRMEMRKSLMIAAIVAMALSLGMAQARTESNPAPQFDARAELAKLMATNMDPNSGFCRKMLYQCDRGYQAACDNFERLCTPED